MHQQSASQIRSGFLFRQNHKQDSEQNQCHTEGDIERKSFVKDQRTNDDGRQRFEDAEDGGLGGTHRLARSRQGDGGYSRRQNRQAQHVQPTDRIGNCIEMHAEARQGKQHHRAYQEAIESQSEVGNSLDLLAQVDEDYK